MTGPAKAPPLAADAAPDARAADAKTSAPSRRAKVFAAVLGALLLLLRRFSLRGMLLCSILSAALAGGLTAYVQTITDVTEAHGRLEVPRRYHQTAIRHATESATHKRIVAFLEALQAAGKLTGVGNLHSITVTFQPNPAQDELQWRIDFEYLTFVHRPSIEIRQAAEKYVAFLVKMTFNKAWREDQKTKVISPDVIIRFPGFQDQLPVAWYIDELLLWSPHHDLREAMPEKNFLIPISSAPSDKAKRIGRSNDPSITRIASILWTRAQWILEHETDSWMISKLRKLQEATLDENFKFEMEFFWVRQEVSLPFVPIFGEDGVVE